MISTSPIVIATRSSTSVRPAARPGTLAERSLRSSWLFMASTRGHLDLQPVLLLPALFGPGNAYGVSRRYSIHFGNRAGRRAAGDCPRELPLPPVQIVGGHLRGSAADGCRSDA